MELALDLWPEAGEDDLRQTYADLLRSDRHKVLLFAAQDRYVAFIHLAIRTDYVEGSDSSPTGFVEGIYVKPDFRRKGISRKLVDQGEQWVRSMGCKQIGSDIYLDNRTSYDFHLSVGFKEAGRLIHFIKDL